MQLNLSGFIFAITARAVAVHNGEKDFTYWGNKGTLLPN